MAKYLLLIYGNEQMWEAMTAQETTDLDAGHAAFVADAGAKVLLGHALESTGTATPFAARWTAGRRRPMARSRRRRRRSAASA